LPFLASAFAISITLVAALVPPIHVPGVSDPNRPNVYPAPPGYQLPWAGGEIHTVTQGENTNFTHNGLAAYAFDFDLNYETIVAARAGKVTLVRQDSNAGGCNAIFSTMTNYVEIDHGDGTSSLYLHLAQNSVLVQPGDLVDQGQPIAVSGETGVTCSADNSAPGPHLHFQVEQTEEGRYFSQSVPIAFDDISKGDGVPQQDESYVSGNYGRGKEQKIKLTPHHVPRDFNPIAPPENPVLVEAVPEVVAVPAPAPDAPNTGDTLQWPTAVPSSTLTPQADETVADTSTSTPVPPTATFTPTATTTPAPATPTDPPTPPPRATPTAPEAVASPAGASPVPSTSTPPLDATAPVANSAAIPSTTPTP
jgi:murein DD-endopeptidase MepM/ murein hydrolase activator NlpD